MLAIQVVAHVGQLRLLGALMRAAADSGVEVSRARAAWSREMLRGTKLALTTTKALSGQAGLRFSNLRKPN